MDFTIYHGNFQDLGNPWLSSTVDNIANQTLKADNLAWSEVNSGLVVESQSIFRFEIRFFRLLTSITSTFNAYRTVSEAFSVISVYFPTLS